MVPGSGVTPITVTAPTVVDGGAPSCAIAGPARPAPSRASAAARDRPDSEDRVLRLRDSGSPQSSVAALARAMPSSTRARASSASPQRTIFTHLFGSSAL